MKKMLVAALFLLSSALAHAGGNFSGDLFPYENYHSSFTTVVDTAKIDRFSIQVAYSSGTMTDLPFTVNTLDIASDTIFGTSHGLATAQPVLLATAPAGAPAPLTTGTTYYVIKVTDNLIQLATTYALAVAKAPIDITAATPSTGTWTLRPLSPVVGSAGFTWEASDDGTNWVSIGSVGSTVNGSTQSLVGQSATIASRLFDWGEFAYKYLRLSFNGPAFGVFKLRATINGKEK